MTGREEAERVAAARLKAADDALFAAIRHFDAQEQAYRNPKGEAAKRMSKKVRQDLAARYAQWSRDLIALRAHASQAQGDPHHG